MNAGARSGEAAEVEGRLFVLVEAGLIEPALDLSDLAYLFRHGLIQAATYATLLRNQRKHWHQTVGDVLEEACQAEPGAKASALAPVLAHHFAMAGDEARALLYFVKAADAAFERFAVTEAADFYAQAIQIARRQSPAAYDPARMLHLYKRHGRSLELNNRFQPALATYEAMEQLGRERGDRALELAALLQRAKVYNTVNFAFDPAKGERLMEAAGALAETLGDQSQRAEIYWQMLLLNTMRGGPVEERVRFAEMALAVAREHGLRDQLATTLQDSWYGYAGGGQWDQARAVVEEACRVAREAHNAPVLREALTRVVVVEMVSGEYEAALRHAQDAYDLGQQTNSPDIQAISHAFIGHIYLERGEIDTALSKMEAAIALALTTETIIVLIGTRANLGLYYGRLGAIERGLKLAGPAQALAAQHIELLLPWPQSNHVRLLAAAGDVAGAAAEAAELPPYQVVKQRNGYIPMMWVNVALAQAELHLARGEAALAVALLVDLVETLRAESLRYCLPEVLCLLGTARLASGKLAQARADLRQAQVEALALGSRWMLWQILAGLAAVEERSGQGEAASALRRQARLIVEQIAGRVPTPELRASFRAQPTVQSLVAGN